MPMTQALSSPKRRYLTIDYVSQLLSVKNNRVTGIEGLGIECAFFAGDRLLGIGSDTELHIKPTETVYMHIVLRGGGIGADRTVCRVSGEY
jgi:hypothetical protein